MRTLASLLCLGAALGLLPSALDAKDPAAGEGLPAAARQFDFWIGVWDVNLRIRAEDGTWPDASVAAEARVYPALDGKAVLELWDSEPIVGFSLRWFDREAGEWKLWLNWPRENDSGGSGLSGRFRHGRGEFFSRRTLEDGAELVSRYTFSDITPTSLRWDDAYSRDGGLTWTHRWIMEFTRKGDVPSLPAEGGAAHTFGDGGRCDLPGFRRFEALAGAWTGTVARPGDAGAWVEFPARLTAWRILGGCAVLARLETEAAGVRRESLHLLTWNTRAERFEEELLDSRPESPLEVYRGGETDGTVELLAQTPEGEARPTVRRRWSLDGGGIALEVERSADGESWETVERASFGG